MFNIRGERPYSEPEGHLLCMLKGPHRLWVGGVYVLKPGRVIDCIARHYSLRRRKVGNVGLMWGEAAAVHDGGSKVWQKAGWAP